MVTPKIKIYKTETYIKSVYSLKNPKDIVAVEKKVNKLLENPNIAIPMKYQHEGFCEIQVGKSMRVYCIKFDGTIIVFVMGIVDDEHSKSYKNPKGYEKIFLRLRKAKEEFEKKV